MFMVKLLNVVIVVWYLALLQTHTATAQAAQVALEMELIVVEEARHSTGICVVVTSGTVVVTSSLTISTMGGSATAGEDFVGIFEEEVTFQPGDVKMCISFTVVDDNRVEGEESLTVQIQSSSLLIGVPHTANINIIDTSRIAVGLVSTEFPVTEGAPVTVCAIIRNGTIGRGVGITIEALPTGTASPGPMDPDFIPRPVAVQFDHRNPSRTVCANFIIVDDNIPPIVAEDDEYFVVSVTSNDNVDVIAEESTAQVVIHDNDGATVRLESNTLSVTEGRAGENRRVDICLVLEDILDGLQRDLYFNLTIVTFVLASEDDVVPQDMLTITFPSHSVVGNTSCTHYTILGDDLKEEDETFCVSVTALNDVDIISGETTVLITILDDQDVIQECGPPPTPGDVLVEYSNITNGSVAVYSCDEGYSLSGQETATCLNNLDTIPGVWSGEPPTCNMVDCGVPPHPGDNGLVAYNNTSFRATATYTCKTECYELIPNIRTITCLSNGSWSRDNMQCHLIECGPTPEVMGCDLTLPVSTSCGSETVYGPEYGFTLDGDDTITCTESGEWRGDIGFTRCQIITCPLLANPNNGTVHTESTLPQPYGTVVNISCDEGFRLEGSDNRTCLTNGMWSGQDTTCVFVECVVVLPDNGNASLNGTGVGATVEYTCNAGYDLEGTSLQVCSENGTFSDPLVTCELLDCGLPVTEDFPGDVEYSNTTYGSITIYTCPGNCSSRNSLCQENGVWTNPALICFSCPLLENPENGLVHFQDGSLFPGSLALYTCDDGFVITNASERKCTCDGWSGVEPSCVDINIVTPGPGATKPTEGENGNDVIIIVVASVGGSVVLVGLCVCAIVVWCCLVKYNHKRNPLRNQTIQRHNYKGNTPYVLPYTIYANRSSTLEPFASNNRNSDIFDPYDSGISSSLRSTDSGYLNQAKNTHSIFPSARGSEFGKSERNVSSSTVRGTRFGVKRQMSLLSNNSNSLAEDDSSTWDRRWVESSLSTPDQHCYDGLVDFDDTSSVVTTSTMPASEYSHRIQTADEQLHAKCHHTFPRNDH